MAKEDVVLDQNVVTGDYKTNKHDEMKDTIKWLKK